MAICPNCGFQNDDQWMFCIKCGTKLRAADAPAYQAYPSGSQPTMPSMNGYQPFSSAYPADAGQQQFPRANGYQNQYPSAGTNSGVNLPPDPRGNWNQQRGSTASASAPWNNNGSSNAAPPRKDPPQSQPAPAAVRDSGSQESSGASGFQILGILAALIMGISAMCPYITVDLGFYARSSYLSEIHEMMPIIVVFGAAVAIFAAVKKNKVGVLVGGLAGLAIFIFIEVAMNNYYSSEDLDFLSELADGFIKRDFGYYGLIVGSIATMLFGLLMPSGD